VTRIVINESYPKGRGDVTATVSAEPITVDVPDDVAAAPAAAIAEGIADRIRAISQRSRDGKRQIFNRTGRLVKELAAIAVAGGYNIVAPAGYLTDDALLERLIDLVPAIADPTVLTELQAAVEKAAADMVTLG
jgi:hypothetical protein